MKNKKSPKNKGLKKDSFQKEVVTLVVRGADQGNPRIKKENDKIKPYCLMMLLIGQKINKFDFQIHLKFLPFQRSLRNPHPAAWLAVFRSAFFESG